MVFRASARYLSLFSQNAGIADSHCDPCAVAIKAARMARKLALQEFGPSVPEAWSVDPSGLAGLKNTFKMGRKPWKTMENVGKSMETPEFREVNVTFHGKPDARTLPLVPSYLPGGSILALVFGCRGCISSWSC